eukprot:COSAG02_NODE_57072_length_282_cov_0.836066_1_plen_49_part_01
MLSIEILFECTILDLVACVHGRAVVEGSDATNSELEIIYLVLMLINTIK